MNPAFDRPDRRRLILIVDDDRDGREVMEIVLNYDGFLTTTAASGEEALAALGRQLPDLILLDVRMPGMDGYEIAAKIKGNVATLDVPIIMMSGLSERDAKVLCFIAGAADFLAKPMDRAEIVSRGKKVLRLTA